MNDFKVDGRLLIGGELRPASDGGSYENVNPATEEMLGTASDGTEIDMELAIAAAQTAFDDTSWSRDHEFRQHCLEQLHDAIVEEHDWFRSLLVEEGGIPVALTGGSQLNTTIDDMMYWARLATDYPYSRDLPDRFDIPVGAVNTGSLEKVASHRMIWREPIGVVGAISPWNSPFHTTVKKFTPALAAGCTVILKPAPETPWTATEIARLVVEKTDIPPGVINIVVSHDHLIGEVLVRDPRVDLITFTGSTATGKRILSLASETVKRTCLELGGKSANVILDDADFDAILPSQALGACTHSGQGCGLLTRMLLPRSRYDEGVDIVRSAFENVSYGDPADPKVVQGPQISERQRQRVLGFIESGKRESCLVVGGGIPERLQRGYFVEPTLFVDVPPDAVIAQQEIFGPVLAVIPYADEEDAVAIANGTPYGLSGAVWSTDAERGLRVASRLRTGTVGVNGGSWLGGDSPFGGYRQSGLGREHGEAGYEEFLEIKSVAIPRG